jgi:epoxide hydrolase-like predicted phosphatase
MAEDQTEQPEIKAICFDLDGVYFTPESFKRFRASLATKTSVEKATEVLNTSAEMASFKRGEMKEEQFWDYARKALELDMDNEAIFELLRNSYEVDKYLVESVRKAYGLGYKTCICSNNFVTRVRELDKQFKFLRHFDVAVFSYEVGYLKPDKRIFEELVYRLKLNPQQVVYADDTPDRLSGAQELGMQTFAFSNYNQFIAELQKLGVSL